MRFGSRKSEPSLSSVSLPPPYFILVSHLMEIGADSTSLCRQAESELERRKTFCCFSCENTLEPGREEGGMRIKLNCVRRPRAHTHTFRTVRERESEILLQIYGWISWPRISVTETCENETSLRERVKSSVNLAFAMEMRIHYFESERKK